MDFTRKIKVEIKQEVIDIDLSPDSTNQDTANHAESEALFTNLQPHNRDNSTGTTSDQISESSISLFQHQLISHNEQSSEPISEITDIAGPYNFKIRHPREENEKIPAKGVSWTYSWSIEELYVKMDVDCPFMVQTSGIPPMGTIIRATLYFRSLEEKNNVPKRCLHHSESNHESNRGRNYAEHIIRCDYPNSVYEKDSDSGRMSTIVPFSSPEMGATMGIYFYRFMCRTSCVGGMNRRAISVVFTLEYNNEVLGRCVRKVKVSACPGRDRTKMEEKLDRDTFGTKNQMSDVNPTSEGVKRAVKRISSSLQNIRRAPTEGKRPKMYTYSTSNKALFHLFNAMVPVLERFLGHQDVSSPDDDELEETYSPVAVVPDCENVEEPDFEPVQEIVNIIPSRSNVREKTSSVQQPPAVNEQWITLFSHIDEIVARATAAITKGIPSATSDIFSANIKKEIILLNTNEDLKIESSTSTDISNTSIIQKGFTVESWLSSLHLSKYLANFKSRGYLCGIQLQDITMEDLSEMGVSDNDSDILWKSLISWWDPNCVKNSEKPSPS